ncbi:MAG: hypothetical protein JXA71_13100 [Chitinispirillaceae bacterium]|nr:hypothetical protein [Chitinispirillaceae bacterium]
MPRPPTLTAFSRNRIRCFASFTVTPYDGERRVRQGGLRTISLLLVAAAAIGIAAPSAAATPATVAPAREKATYLAKDYIDSTVHRAIFIINDAASTAGVGFRTKESLDEAWRMARRIKAEAKGDPNERYAFWKVNELEWLIRLEERDLVMQRMKEGEATVNKIIAEYNAEVGKARPDFKNLTRMHTRMLEFDTRQANAMASSINNRIKTLSREAVLGLEKALLSRNSPLVDREYKYLLRNRPYLAISEKTFDDLESRASACARAQDELPTVKTEIDKARHLVEKVQLSGARSMLAFAQYRLSDIRSFIPGQDASRLQVGIGDVERELGRKEDSLIGVNLDILGKKGVEAANEYLQRVVREKGVCRAKAARVDQAILDVGSPVEKSRISQEIDEVASATERTPENDIIEEMRAKAMKKAQKKLDSIRAVDEARARREQKQRDRLEAAARKAATEDYRKNKDLSVRTASKIYDLIEKKKARVAFDLFLSKQKILQQYLAPDAYAMIETTVKETSNPDWNSGGDEIFYLTPVAETGSGAGAASLTDGNREKAMATVVEIYEMLDRSEKAEAQGRFDREKDFLKRYLDKEAFDMIKLTVAHLGR